MKLVPKKVPEIPLIGIIVHFGHGGFLREFSATKK